MASLPTHALFSGNTFVGEVTPNALNVYPAANLVKLPATYWARGFAWTWSGRTPVEDAATVQAILIVDLKAEAERCKMLLLSSGGAKKTEYADKAREVSAWDSLNGNVVSTVAQLLLTFNSYSAERKASTFPYAIADAAAFGDTIKDAITRFRTGMLSSTTVATLAAKEARGCAAIRAATTPAAKRTAAAAVTWPA